MARLDALIRRLSDPGAEEVLLQSGGTPFLRTAEGRVALLKQALTTAQIVAVIGEILPAELRARFPLSGETRFVYASPTGEVEVVFDMNASRATASLHRPGLPEGLADRSADGPAMVVPWLSKAREEPALHVLPVVKDRELPADPREAVEALLAELGARSGSDLHLRGGSPPVFRVDGEMEPAPELGALTAERVHALVSALAPERNRAEFAERGDTDFAHETADARFRVNVLRDRNGAGAVIRLIPSKVKTAEELGLSPALLELCQLRKGLVLVTGPTGSGKSTTLAALVDQVNATRADHILTIEDPIEFVHAPKRCLVTQREVSVHTRGFKEALRAALREDPDVVLVGELRDLETVAIALETAETGHLVFGTLHTSTAPGTVDRIIDQFPSERQAQVRVALSESLKAVVAQTLCKRIGGGRVAAHEVLLVNSAVSNLIREGKTFQLQSVMQTGKAQGMVTLNDALLQLVRANLVEPQEAVAKAVAKAELKAMLERAGANERRDSSQLAASA